MSKTSSGIVPDSPLRFLRSIRKEIEAKIREEHAAELAAATGDYWRQLAIEVKIEREVQRRLDRVKPSPYSV